MMNNSRNNIEQNKNVDSLFCRLSSLPDKTRSLLLVSPSKRFSLYAMCSDQHVKFSMPRGFLFTSSFLLDYHVKNTHSSNLNNDTNNNNDDHNDIGLDGAGKPS